MSISEYASDASMRVYEQERYEYALQLSYKCVVSRSCDYIICVVSDDNMKYYITFLI